MGLDAYVRCNCIERGKAKPHPFPRLLRFDENREPLLPEEASYAQWVAHDRWLEKSCPHSGVKIAIRIGNISHVAELRHEVQELGANSFPIVLEKILYSGSHSGDSLPVRIVPKLQCELKLLRELAGAQFVLQFARDMERLCKASLKNCKPIVF